MNLCISHIYIGGGGGGLQVGLGGMGLKFGNGSLLLLSLNLFLTLLKWVLSRCGGLYGVEALDNLDKFETLPLSNFTLNSEALLVLVSLEIFLCLPSDSIGSILTSFFLLENESLIKETLLLFSVLILGRPKASTLFAFLFGTKQSSLSDFLLDSLPGLGGFNFIAEGVGTFFSLSL